MITACTGRSKATQRKSRRLLRCGGHSIACVPISIGVADSQPYMADGQPLPSIAELAHPRSRQERRGRDSGRRSQQTRVASIHVQDPVEAVRYATAGLVTALQKTLMAGQ